MAQSGARVPHQLALPERPPLKAVSIDTLQQSSTPMFDGQTLRLYNSDVVLMCCLSNSCDSSVDRYVFEPIV